MSKIEWTDKTWNPIAGCSKVSEGCRNCYAETMAKRLVAMGQPKYQGTTDLHGHWTGIIKLDEKALELPLKTKKPTRFFVNSMSDLFHDNVPEDWIKQVFRVMDQTPHHTYQILTKRPERMKRILNSANWWGGRFIEHTKHIWLGVSVENQKAADERIPLLIRTAAAVRFLSCEPLLGPLDLNSSKGGTLWIGGQRGCVGVHHGLGTPDCPKKPHHHHDDRCLKGIDWVISGGESGPNARPMHPDWVRSLRDQCNAAGVPFFFKQWGEFGPKESISEGRYISIGKKIDDALLYKAGKKRSGRVLDGRTWDELP